VADRRTLVLGAGTAVAVAVPLTLALTDRHLAGASAALTLSTAAGALAVSALAIQPLLARRARMALIATIALLGVVALGALRTRLPIGAPTWRVAHAYLAVVTIALGIGHAVLTDGALDDAGTVVLLGLGAVGLLGVPAAHVARTRRAAGRQALPRARATSDSSSAR